MEFKLNFNIDESSVKLNHSDGLVLIGSCFSDEIATRLSLNGFQNLANPYGTLFHPLAIANAIRSTINEDTKVNSLKSGEVFHAWDCAGIVHGYSEEELIRNVLSARASALKQIKEAKFLFITFGTAWGYKHEELDLIVGNCHKHPQKNFKKTLSPIEEMKSSWMDLLVVLKELNKDLKVVFTVSPVRHKKDGLIENNRSKARLLELVHTLTELSDVSYFPSYEIVIDELRDYHFFSKDLVHPSEVAVDYVWDKFETVYCNEETKELSGKVKQIKNSLAHKSLYPNSDSHKNMVKEMTQKKDFLLNKYPFLKF